MNTLTDQMLAMQKGLEKSFDVQSGSLKELVKSVDELMSKKLGNIDTSKLKELQQEAGKSTVSAKALSNRMTELSATTLKKVHPAFIVATAAMNGFRQGLRNVTALGKGFVGFTAQAAKSIFNIGAAILAAPLHMLKKLVGIAAQSGGGMNELAQAIEDVRKSFGNLRTAGAKAILDTSKSFKGFEATGLSTFRVFGFMHDRIKAVRETAEGMGATFSVLKNEFVENGGALMGFQKGLGVTNEQMGAIGQRALTMGQPMNKVFLDMTKQTLELGKAFDIDQKLIGKDMAKALQNVAHFGQLTVKEIAQASVYARKLGLELDKIVGTLSAFETFDSAAENAAKLSQTFGVQIDAFKMMEAQNPAEQIEALRKSFRAAGVDASKFSRQQLALVAQTTGLDAATAKQAFSMQNAGASYDSIKRKSEAAAKKQMTQEEAMSKLADSIERLVMSGGGQLGSFWDMFVKGFFGGIQSSKEFMTLMFSIKQALSMVYMQGIRLGKAFANMPSIKSFFGGLAEFFNPKKMQEMVGGCVTILSDGKKSVAEKMEGMRGEFSKYFNKQKGAFDNIVNGAKEFGLQFSKALSGIIRWVSDKVADGLQAIADLVTGKKKLAVGGAASGALGFLEQFFGPLIDSLKYAWNRLKGPLEELARKIWDKFVEFIKSPRVSKLLKKILPWAVGILFGPAAIQAAIGAIITAGPLIINAITGLFTGGGAVGAFSKAASLFGKILGSSLGKGVGIAGAVIALSTNIDTVFDKFESSVKTRCGETEGTIGLSVGGVANALTLGLLPDSTIESISIASAEFAGKVLKKLEKCFGPGFSESFGTYLREELNLLREVGNAIKAIFTGDTAEISDSVVAVGEKIIDVLVSAIVFTIKGIPRVITKAVELGLLFTEKFYEVMSKVCEKLGDIPILGYLFKLIGLIYKGAMYAFRGIKIFVRMLGLAFSEAVDWLSEKLGPTIEEFKIAFSKINEKLAQGAQEIADAFMAAGRAIGRAFTACYEAAVQAWSWIKDVFSSVCKWFDDYVVTPIGNAFETVWETIKKIFSWENIKKFFKGVVNNVIAPFEEVLPGVREKMLAAAAESKEAMSQEYEVQSPSKWSQRIGSRIVEGLGLGIKDMPDVMKDSTADTTSMFESILGIDSASSAISNLENLENLNNVSSQLSGMSDAVTSIAASSAQLIGNINSGALKEAMNAVKQMVKVVNEMDDALSDDTLNKFNVKAKLEKVATSLGLGAKAEYTIKNKAVNIKLNLNITMDAGQVEKVMIMRSSSIIRQRLNFATTGDTAGQRGEPALPGAYQSSVADITKSSS